MTPTWAVPGLLSFVTESCFVFVIPGLNRIYTYKKLYKLCHDTMMKLLYGTILSYVLGKMFLINNNFTKFLGKGPSASVFHRLPK